VAAVADGSGDCMESVSHSILGWRKGALYGKI